MALHRDDAYLDQPAAETAEVENHYVVYVLNPFIRRFNSMPIPWRDMATRLTSIPSMVLVVYLKGFPDSVLFMGAPSCSTKVNCLLFNAFAIS